MKIYPTSNKGQFNTNMTSSKKRKSHTKERQIIDLISFSRGGSPEATIVTCARSFMKIITTNTSRKDSISKKCEIALESSIFYQLFLNLKKIKPSKEDANRNRL